MFLNLKICLDAKININKKNLIGWFEIERGVAKTKNTHKLH